MERDEELLLAVLNSAPVLGGRVSDHIDGPSGRELAQSWGGTGTADESDRLRRARDVLHSVIRGPESPAIDALAGLVDAVVRTPRVTPDGVVWDLQAPDDDRLAVDVVLAWSSVVAAFPGRLRACANDECNLFLVDHSRPGTAKWCSMATCGNRMKARAHADRSSS
ncbi:CGNR zinc finger domain-containing protein [Cryobacterium sp. PAMC25264]|uniref:CGNR zinc finger domain-containing protein n=1 Tax=Cryobacterium sp. PAMC25264 TaxID=2861288 RepID=UPI001C633569|nr:CGNR zinc finger domain-containing protein [Cryobacterium sp. PAMC25264]QYF74448.1 CGNR zinc finger domain-containing protein [Cryobacterium sp. PAMC25264]